MHFLYNSVYVENTSTEYIEALGESIYMRVLIFVAKKWNLVELDISLQIGVLNRLFFIRYCLWFNLLQNFVLSFVLFGIFIAQCVEKRSLKIAFQKKIMVQILNCTYNCGYHAIASCWLIANDRVLSNLSMKQCLSC